MGFPTERYVYESPSGGVSPGILEIQIARSVSVTMDKRLLQETPEAMASEMETYELYVNNTQEEQNKSSSFPLKRSVMIALASIVVVGVVVAAVAGSFSKSDGAVQANDLEGSIGSWIHREFGHRRRRHGTGATTGPHGTNPTKCIAAPTDAGFALKVSLFTTGRPLIHTALLRQVVTELFKLLKITDGNPKTCVQDVGRADVLFKDFAVVNPLFFFRDLNIARAHPVPTHRRPQRRMPAVR